jgi:predicted Zn-dependent protease
MTAPHRIVMVLALAGLGGCITDPVTGKSVIGRPTSDAEEEQMGASYRPQILAQFKGEYPDPALQKYLSDIVVGMGKKSVRPEMPWSFTVVNTSDVNAFAIPGGELFITRGLLWRLDDEAEFAVVMGHEVGHVEHRHAEQGMVRDTGAATIIQAAAERVGLSSLAAPAQTLLLTRFSRDQEREADVQGVKNSYRAGYDPRRGAEVFKKFLALKNGQESATDAWTSDHPLDSERIENIEKLCGETDQRLAGTEPVAGLKVDVPRFTELVAKLREEEKVYDKHDAALAAAQKTGAGKDALVKAIPALKACADALPNHAYLASDLGRAYAASGDAANAQTWLQRAADMHQGLLDPELVLGVMALQSKKFDEAAAHAQKGLEILPDNYPCRYISGEANLGLGRADQAKADFEAVVQSAPPDSAQYKAAASRLGLSQQPAQKKSKR